MTVSPRALLFATALLAPAALWARAAPSPIVTAAAADAPEEIIVYGHGQVRQQAEISGQDIQLLAPGSSAFRAIEKLPGVNFQSADAFGVYEWSTRISLRGFNQNQLGFTLDGVPLGDMSYGNTNGLHISRAIISDNIGVTRVSQGAGALGTASTSNLGGTIEFESRAPSDTLGLTANATYGSEDTLRLFARAETGQVGAFRGWVSAGWIDAGKWKGDGAQRAFQVNAKGVADLGGGTTLTGYVSYSDRKENDYQDLSLEMIRRLGYDWDNISNDFALARRIAFIAQNRGDVGSPCPGGCQPALGRVYPAPFQTVDDAYYDAGGLRRDWLAYLKLDASLSDAVSATVQGYYHHNKGQGSWFTPYIATGPADPISFRTTEYGIDRYGVISRLRFDLGGGSNLEGGIWYENNDFNQARRFYPVTGTTTPSTTALTFQTNPFFTQWFNSFSTKTVQVYAQANLALTEALTLTGGFKGVQVDLSARQNIPNALAQGSISNRDWFQPQIGLLFRVDAANELFANYTENLRAFTAASTGLSPFATTQAGFNAIQSSLRPERSRTVEGGYRFGAGAVRGVIAAYYVEFSNRLLATTTGAGIVGNPTVLANVGRVRSVGVEAGATWRIAPPLTLTASYAYNDSSYRDNVVNAQGVITQAIEGDTVVDSPRHIGNVNLAYDDGQLFGQVNANGMSKRFFTYSNDQSVGGRVLVDATVGFRIRGGGFADGFGISGSVTNIFDRRYVSTIGSNGFGFSGDNQTLLAGAPRQWFITLRKDL